MRPSLARVVVLVCVAVLAVGCDTHANGASAPEPSHRSVARAAEATAAVDEATAEKAERQTAVLAGGCFWGMEEILRAVPGVLDTEVGYAGGADARVSYTEVRSGGTGHAESVRVVFDPSKISYAELLEKWFFRMHDPTTLNRQGNDVGTQYRSAIFYDSEPQKRTALAVKARVEKSGKWKDPVVTEIAPLGAFVVAEQYHQDYLQKNPGGYTCHYLRD